MKYQKCKHCGAKTFLAYVEGREVVCDTLVSDFFSDYGYRYHQCAFKGLSDAIMVEELEAMGK